MENVINIFAKVIIFRQTKQINLIPENKKIHFLFFLLNE